MKQILTRLECQRKAFFESHRFTSSQTKALLIKKAILAAINEEGFWNIATPLSIDKHFNSIDEQFFQLKTEKTLEVEIIQRQLARMLFYFKIKGYQFVGSEISGEVEFNDEFYGIKIEAPEKLKKTFDIVLRCDGNVYVCKLSRRAPVLTTRKGSNNHGNNSIELMLMQIIGEQIYPDECVIPAFISLTGSNETSFSTVSDIDNNEFESREGRNFVSHHFYLFPEALLVQVAKAMNMKINHESPKNCDHCGACNFQKVCLFDNANDIPLHKIVTTEKIQGAPVFTPEQLKVVTFKKGHARVLAGAGSGKTTSLINRVIYLMSEDETLVPEDFLLITFTEKGAKEIKEKLIFWLAREGYGEKEYEKFQVTTFNGFGQKIVEENYKTLGFESSPRLVERIEQIDIIKDILEQYPAIPTYNYRNPLLEVFNAKGVILKVADLITKMKEKGVSSVEQFEILFPLEEIGRLVSRFKYYFDYKIGFEMYQKYLKALRDHNLIDYTDQVNLALQLVQNREVANEYNYRHIILDEFQDTSFEQLLMIKHIKNNSSRFESILACGDDAQAIFSFRGVGIENILEFPKHFSSTKSFFMTNNFRSSKPIVDLANYVISFSFENLEKALVATKPGELPKFVLVDNQTEYIAKGVKSVIEQGVPLEDIAVIARTRRELQAVNDILKKEGIATIMSTSERLIDNQRVIGIISLARFLKDHKDTVSLMQWLQVKDYKSFIVEANLSNLVAINKQLILDEVEGMDSNQLAAWFKLQIKGLERDDRAVDKLNDILAGIEDMVAIHSLLNKMDIYSSGISIELDDASYRAVTLTTVHAAKGREFKRVFIAYDKYKINGSAKMKGKSFSASEEIRLLFVAVTRAMNHLTIVSTESLDHLSLKYSNLVQWHDVRKES